MSARNRTVTGRIVMRPGRLGTCLLKAAVMVLISAAIAGGVANATIPGAGKVYTACMLKSVGTIRLIDNRCSRRA
jgi:hypothetical protein